MAKYEVKTKTEENLEELARISFNVRHYKKIWEEHFGAINRDNLRRWEEKLDSWLEQNVRKVEIGRSRGETWQ